MNGKTWFLRMGYDSYTVLVSTLIVLGNYLRTIANLSQRYWGSQLSSSTLAFVPFP